MRPFILFFVVPLFTLLAMTPAYAAEWSKPYYDKTDHGYYALIRSARFNNSLLGIYTYPESDCTPMLVAVTLMEDKAYDEGLVGAYDSTMQLRIDAGSVHTVSSRTQAAYGTFGEYNYRILKMLVITDSQMAEFTTGHIFYLRDGPGDDEADKFSLAGSQRALNDVVTKCHALGTDEWTAGPATPSTNNEWSL